MKAMEFVSTRGRAPNATAVEAAVRGLAPDGGLYMPAVWPQLGKDFGAGQSYPELVASVAAPFLEGSITDERLRLIATKAYAKFPQPDPIPIQALEDDILLAELFHGPTCSFKDLALQFIGGLYEELVGASDRPLLVIGATTGDTGPAAIAALEGRPGLAVVMLHPYRRISKIQRRQMTCATATNVLNIAVEGSFDDCQAIVKRLLHEPDAGSGARRTTPNSINIFRIIAQCAYYFWIADKIGDGVSFAVPSGNFGNAFSGFAACRMGAAVNRIVVATNRNDVLFRALTSGRYQPGRVHPTISPAMDISVASNFERLLFALSGNDPRLVAGLFENLAQNDAFDIPVPVHNKLRRQFASVRVDEQATRRALRQLYERHDLIVDPHSAIGCQAAWTLRSEIAGPIAVLATADPAKFSGEIRETLGIDPPVPPAIAALDGRQENFVRAEADLSAVKALISDWNESWK